MSEINSKMLLARLNFYKKNPTIAVCEANDDLIAEFAEQNVLSLELLNTWIIAGNALEGRLAPNTASVEAAPPEPAPAPETPAAPEENLKDLSVEELRKIVKSQRTRFEKVLPSIYTPEKIKALPAAELRHLQTMYGSKALNTRLTR